MQLMLYGAIWALLHFALAEFTKTSHEGQVVFYTNDTGDILLLYMVLRSRQVFFNGGGGGGS